MTEFRINVVIDPQGAVQGSRSVERQLTRVESSANRVQIALRRAFAFVTLGFAVREVTRYADSLTDLQNRLRLLVPEQTALVRTTRDLLGVANDTRTAFEGTVILYQRLGLATRELGLNQNGLLGIVKSINQALILSGASAKEANNGLIQLSQGIASNRLGGDELRSTLEQLPAVADVIARQLGVTRGELRELGAEGKITGDVIIEAFRNAQEELDQQFGRTVPTLAQSFTVLRNNLTVFIGELNQGTGTLAAFGAIIRFIGNNIDVLVRSIVVASAAFAALRLAPVVKAFFDLQAAVKAGNAVILGSAQAAKQKAIFDREQAAAAVTVAAAEVQKAQAIIAETQAEAAQSAQTTRSIQLEESKIAVQLQSRAASLQAAQAALAQAEAERASLSLSGTLADVRTRIAIADADVAATRRGVVLATDQLTAAEARLALAQGAVADAALLASVDQGRLASAHTAAARAAEAQAAAEARLTAATAAANAQANIFTRTLSSVRAGVSRLTAVIAANPLGALLVVLTAVGTALFVFRDRIKLAEGSLATLGDFIAEFGDQAGAAFAFIIEELERTFGDSFTIVREFVDNFRFSFRDIIEFGAAFADTLIGIFAGIFAFIGSLVLDFPQIIERGFKLGVNAAITALEFLPDVVIGIVKTIGQTLDIFISGLIGSFRELGVAAQQALAGNFEAAGEAAENAAFLAANAFERASSGLGSRFARNIAAEIDDELIPRLDTSTTEGFGEIGSKAADSFAAAFNANPVLGFVGGLFAGAESRAEDRAAAEAAQAEAEARQRVATAAAAQATNVGNLIAQLRQEQDVLLTTVGINDQLSESSAEINQNLADSGIENLQLRAEILRQILDVNTQLAEQGLAPLSADQQTEIAQLIQRNDQLRQFSQLQQELIPIEEQFAQRRNLIAEAFLEGAISLDQYTEALRRVREEELALGTSISDGLSRGITRVSEQINDLASVTETAFVNAFTAAEDALVSFVDTGEFDFRQFARNIILDITRIVARLLLLQAIQAAAGVGGPVGNFFGQLAGVDQAADGSTAAVANKPFIVGEEGPEIFTPGQTGSITPTDQTISALSQASSAQGQTTVVQAPAPQVNVSVVNVTDPNEALNALDTPDGEQRILNVLQKNPETLRRITG